MLVGAKAIATLSTGYLNALEYAKTRIQGADLTQAVTTQRATRDDRPSSRCPPLPDDPEVVRRRPAGTTAVRRDHPGSQRNRSGNGEHDDPPNG